MTAEQRAALARISGLIEYWRFTPEEIAAARPCAPEPPRSAAIKYVHPKTGETWDGVGTHPDWLRRALLQEGYRVDELRPPGTAAAP